MYVNCAYTSVTKWGKIASIRSITLHHWGYIRVRKIRSDQDWVVWDCLHGDSLYYQSHNAKPIKENTTQWIENKSHSSQIYLMMKVCAQWTSTSATPLVDTLHTFPLSQTPVLFAAQNISASQSISCGSDFKERLFSVSWTLQTLHAKWQHYDWTLSTWPK